VIYNTLNKNKIEIPFPQQDVYVRHLEMPARQSKKHADVESVPAVQQETPLDAEPQDVPTVPRKRGRPRKTDKKA